MTMIRRVLGLGFLCLLVLTAVQVNVSLAGKNKMLKERVAEVEAQVSALTQNIGAVERDSKNGLVQLYVTMAQMDFNAERVRTRRCAAGEPAVWREADLGLGSGETRIILAC